MENLSYKKIREETNNSKDIHTDIVKHIGNARQKKVLDALYIVPLGQPDTMHLYEEFLREEKNIEYLREGDSALEAELPKYKSHNFGVVLKH
jgi:hypothetical protein